MQQRAGRVARTDEQRAAACFQTFFQRGVAVHAVRQARIQRQGRCEHRAEEIDRDGHTPFFPPQQQRHHDKNRHRDGRRHTQAEELHDLGIAPQAVIHAHQAVDDLIAAYKEKAAGDQQAVVFGKRGTPRDERPWQHIRHRHHNDVERDQYLLSEPLCKGGNMAQQNFITNLYLHPALLQARWYACKARRPDGPVRGGARKQPPRRLILSYFTPSCHKSH